MIRSQMSQGKPEGDVPVEPSCAVSAGVYLKLNINFQYGACAGLKRLGGTLEAK